MNIIYVKKNHGITEVHCLDSLRVWILCLTFVLFKMTGYGQDIQRSTKNVISIILLLHIILLKDEILHFFIV